MPTANCKLFIKYEINLVKILLSLASKCKAIIQSSCLPGIRFSKCCCRRANCSSKCLGLGAVTRIFKRGSYIGWSSLGVSRYKYSRPGLRGRDPDRGLLGVGVCLNLEVVLVGRCHLRFEGSRNVSTMDDEHTPSMSIRKLLLSTDFG